MRVKVVLILLFSAFFNTLWSQTFIRLNQLGYLPEDPKSALVMSTDPEPISFVLETAAGDPVIKLIPTKTRLPGWGKFTHQWLLDFTAVTKNGLYRISSDKKGVASRPFEISPAAYNGLTEKLLEFMQQQRCGYNPYFDIHCHQHDGMSFFGQSPDSTIIDVRGGWHDAGDQLKYLITSSYATAHMLLSYDLYPDVFDDLKDENGKNMPNGLPDILDEARWGLEWIFKLHPNPEELVHQVADDRDHIGFKFPDQDQSDYGWGPASWRPAYFATGQPQGLNRYQSEATGIANLAGRSAAAMALAARIWRDRNEDTEFADKCKKAARSLYQLGKENEGFQQGNSYGAPYRYNEKTWADDMEWAAAELFTLTGEKPYLNDAKHYADLAGNDTWMPRDTAEHYLFYPFVNIGHFALYRHADQRTKQKLARYYRQGIEQCLQRGNLNNWQIGVPFIWCSNNLLTGLITQIILYEQMTGDLQYHEFLTRQRDWLFGRNPWGTSMLTGIPADGEYPLDVHTSTWALTHDLVPGGLIDGPVYTSIFESLQGLTLTHPDEMADFQSQFTVYHDDIGDYSTNEPTMDGTAGSMIMAAFWSRDKKLTHQVNPFIGTGGKGKTYPGATTPFGMVQLSPDNGRSGWDWISGYFYPDTIIAGFSHLHLSGTGAGDLYDLSFFTWTGTPKLAPAGELGPQPTPYSTFSHEKEEAHPGYYRVWLNDYKIEVELSATRRTGIQKYTYHDNQQASVVLDLNYARNWDAVSDARLEMVNDSTIAGYRHSTGWAKDQRVFFWSVLSQPVDSFLITEDVRKITLIYSVKPYDQLMIKTGISSVSIENARENLYAEQPGFDFDSVRYAADHQWERQLSKIRIQTDPNNSQQFYTALYHSMLGPTLFSDVNGEFKGPDGNMHQADTYERYATFSLWDTYRATHPLATLLHPQRTADFIQSMLDHYQSYGLLPVWELLGNETNMMMGYHGVPVIADAILKNIPGFEYQLAYEAMKKSAMQDGNGLKEYRKMGYVPFTVRNWNVSLTLEYAFDDWCIAQVARKLGYQNDYDTFMERSKYYQNHFDPETGFMRAKDTTGAFRPDFHPNAYHPEDYCEANAWHYSFYVPHDLPGLARLHGGNKALAQKIDQQFRTPQETAESTVWISGYIGQYVHGNEPSHHVPYIYSMIGFPHKTQYWVRRIVDELYTTEPDGICGNEDYGQMSAWYVFSGLGFYPMNPTGGQYVLGSPAVENAEISLPGGEVFSIKALNQSPENRYVKSIFLNGRELKRNYISHNEILAGGEIVFEMSKEPNR